MKKKSNAIIIAVALIVIIICGIVCYRSILDLIDYNNETTRTEHTIPKQPPVNPDEEKQNPPDKEPEQPSVEKNYSITVSISNGTYKSDNKIKESESGVITVTANSDYTLPSSISVNNASYQYDKENGKIEISEATGNVYIRINCVRIPEEYTVKTALKPTLEELKTLDFTKGNYVLACDYYGNQEVVMYDLDYYENNLEECEIWTLKPTLIDPKTKQQIAPSSCICSKLRYTNEYGLVCLVGNTYGYICLYSFPDGELLKYYKVSQPNLHSCEILPNGTVISMGINDDYIRVFNPGDSTYSKLYHGEYGHSVIYDSKANKLYTAGGPYVRRWNVEIDANNKAVLTEEKVCCDSLNDPHDITFDPFDDNRIYITDNFAQYVLYKDSCKLENINSISQCKAYGYNNLGTLIYNYATYSYLTHTITTQYKGYKFQRELTSSYREFYKTSPVNIDYMYSD